MITRVKETIDEINGFVCDENWLMMDFYITFATYRDLETPVLIAMIRGTYPFRSKLTNWHLARNLIIEELQKRNENPNTLMKGL